MKQAGEMLSHGVVVIGCGRLGSHLAKALMANGIEVRQLYGRNLKCTQAIAEKVGTSAVNHPVQIVPDADLYIITVPDDHIREVSLWPVLKNKFQVHCSGATPMKALKGTRRRGVLYPLQTFSMQSEPDWNSIPLCIEASDERERDILQQVAMDLSPLVYHVPSDKRLKLHLAAVFAGNFTNHMLTVAENLLADAGLPENLVHPLFRYASEKAVTIGPVLAQTGPAMRNDEKVLKKHNRLLKDYRLLRKIYTLLSDSIRQSHAKD